MKKVTSCFLFLFFIINLYSFDADRSGEKKVSFRAIIDFYANPYFYEPKYSNNSLSLNGRIMAGVQFKQFNFGFSMYENYSTYGENSSKSEFLEGQIYSDGLLIFFINL